MKGARILVILVAALGLMVCLAGISLAKKPVGTAFTYSGKLVKDGEPVDDPCDFLCTLWDDPCAVAEVNQVGDTLVFDELEVKKGKFRLRLDFGSDPNVFNGEMRWLEIGVRAGNLDDPCEYLILEPRVELTAAPYAVNAGNISGKKVVKSEHLGDKAVDPNKIADKAVRKEHIEDKAVDPNKIADKAVRKEHIEDKAVDPNKIADKAVRKEHIEDKAVDPNKIADKAVRKEHLEEGIVDANKLGDVSGYDLQTSYLGSIMQLRNYDEDNIAPILELETYGTGEALKAICSSPSALENGPAIYGSTSNGPGVYGKSDGSITENGFGVHGENLGVDGTGVYGNSVGGRGVHGHGVTGVYGTSTEPSGWAGWFGARVMVEEELVVGGGAGDPCEVLHVGGKVYIEEMDPGSGQTVRWQNKRLTIGTSSARFKDDIQPLKDDFDKILQAESKSFVWKSSGKRGIGFIAEEFDALGLRDLVFYDKAGRPDGVSYELVPLYLLEVVKEQVRATEELRAENESLKQRIEALERSAQGNQLINLKGVAK